MPTLPALESIIKPYEVPEVTVPPVIFNPVEVKVDPAPWVILGMVISIPVQVEVVAAASVVKAPDVKEMPLAVVVEAAVVVGRVIEVPVTDWAALVTLVERSMLAPVKEPAKVATAP